jgi:predicted TIM-barrel fold metal-dependent hydrolase
MFLGGGAPCLLQLLEGGAAREVGMQGKIGLEEHFAIAQTLADSSGFVPERCWGELSRRLIDVRQERLAAMDAHGMAMMILSLNAPTVQGIPEPQRAAAVARAANDALAQEVARRPDRFAALAALPMQDVELAARELERCVKTLGFCGALVNGFSQVADPRAALYYDTPEYWPFWETVEGLGVPFYLHPRNPLPAWAKIYEGHSWLLGPTWGFGVEAATHALRLMGSGLFDRCPASTSSSDISAKACPTASGGSTTATTGPRRRTAARRNGRWANISAPTSILPPPAISAARP